MKFLSMRDAKNSLGECLDVSQRDRVVITRHGRPSALLIGIEGEDLETVDLGSDPHIHRIVSRNRSEGVSGMTQDEVERLVGLRS